MLGGLRWVGENRIVFANDKMCTRPARVFRFKRWPIIRFVRRKTISCTIYQPRVAVTWHAEGGTRPPDSALLEAAVRVEITWRSPTSTRVSGNFGRCARPWLRFRREIYRFYEVFRLFVFFVSVSTTNRDDNGDTNTATIQRPDDKYARPAESRYGSSYPTPGSSVISDSVAGRFRCPSNKKTTPCPVSRLAPFVRVAGIHTVITRKQAPDVHNCLY